jgi:hypothetical protein
VFAWSKHFGMSLATRDWPCCNIKFYRCVIGICCPRLQQARAAIARLRPTTRCWCLRCHPHAEQVRSAAPPPSPKMLLHKKSWGCWWCEDPHVVCDVGLLVWYFC